MTGAELKTIRLKLGWSQARLAYYLDVSGSAISAYETDYRPIPHPKAFRDAFETVFRRIKKLQNRGKLTEAEILDIRRKKSETDITEQKLALEYGVTKQMISLIVLGKSWQDLPKTIGKIKYAKRGTPRKLK